MPIKLALALTLVQASAKIKISYDAAMQPPPLYNEKWQGCAGLYKHLLGSPMAV